LKSIASLAKGHLRKSDIIARWGGDEFVILFQKCDAETAICLMNKIREHISTTLNEGKSNSKVSISAGVVGYEPGDNGDTLLARADKYLYKAKRKGRNLVAGVIDKPDQMTIVKLQRK